MDEPQEPAPFRVWWVPQIPCDSFTVDVPTYEVARLLTDTLARYDLFQYENRIKPDYANVGGIQRWDADLGEYVDVDEEDE